MFVSFTLFVQFSFLLLSDSDLIILFDDRSLLLVFVALMNILIFTKNSMILSIVAFISFFRLNSSSMNYKLREISLFLC